MMTVLEIAGWTFFALWVMGNLFVLMMHFKRVKDKWGLTWQQKVLAYPIAPFAILLDYILRQFPFSLFLWRAPEWETISRLLEDETKYDDGWRAEQARWWRENWLADFDPSGSHGNPGRDDPSG